MTHGSHKRNLRVLFSAAAIICIGCAAAGTAFSQLTVDEKTQLQQQLQQIENEIAQYQQELNSIKGEKNTLQNKVRQLQKQQASLTLQIQSSVLQVAELDRQLAETHAAIISNTEKTSQLQAQLADIIRLVQQRDDYPFLYTLVAKGNLSDTLDELERYTSMTDSLRGLLNETVAAKAELDRQVQSLAGQQDETKNLISIRTLQQQELLGSVSEQNDLLQQTRGRETDYQIVLNETQKQAAEIRNRIYQLTGVTTQITFGQAVQIAQEVSDITGVRAAFLLAILTQESNLGKNVGTCNRAGDPPEKSWKVVMKPERDQQPFLEITRELGLDPDTTPISCPMKDSKGGQVGWGGAMGPAQFIPSTWMGYKDKVAALTGKTANPWDIRDAFVAAGIKLKADGAGTQAGEWAAAMKYFSGSTNTKYRFYGDNVVAQAEKYQKDIDNLGN